MPPPWGEDITVKAEIYTGLDSPFSGKRKRAPTSRRAACCVGQQDLDHGGYVTLLENGVPLEKGSLVLRL